MVVSAGPGLVEGCVTLLICIQIPRVGLGDGVFSSMRPLDTLLSSSCHASFSLTLVNVIAPKLLLFASANVCIRFSGESRTVGSSSGRNEGWVTLRICRQIARVGSGEGVFSSRRVTVNGRRWLGEGVLGASATVGEGKGCQP